MFRYYMLPNLMVQSNNKKIKSVYYLTIYVGMAEQHNVEKGSVQQFSIQPTYRCLT